MAAGLPARLKPSGDPRPEPRIVHLGLGAFFRAHCASYIADATDDWGVIGVSLRSPTVRDKLRPQGFAYTAAELSPNGTKTRQIEVLRDVLVAPEDPQDVLDTMADPMIEIVSLTITEKGYCHDPATGKLNFEHPDIIHDLENDLPYTAIGFIVRALQMRRAIGLPPFTVLSCDNLSDNGALIGGLVTAFAARIDQGLADWIDETCCFPSTMVDRIVPATTEADIETVAQVTGCHDAAPVMHEPFRQWVIEDHFVGARPPFDAAGVQFVDDIAPFEDMKLRMLNGTHSAIAYVGYLSGHKTVAGAVADPVIASYIRQLWVKEIIPTLAPPPETSLTDYADALFARYANPAIQHSTWQIAMDGSQKLPQRILATIADAQHPTPGLILAIAAWMTYVSGRDELGNPIDVQDPQAAQLRACTQDADPVQAFLSLLDIFEPALAARIKPALTQSYDTLQSMGARASAGQVTA